MKIFVLNNKKEGKFLRTPVPEFNLAKANKKELRELIRKMRKIMKSSDGVGLSANQLGLNVRLFVAEVDEKFYAVFNPKISKISPYKIPLEEGCLSVPDSFGIVNRSEKITLTGIDLNGKTLKIKAWGMLARIFQHEVDHLDGKLFLDKSKDVYKINKKSDSIKI